MTPLYLKLYTNLLLDPSELELQCLYLWSDEGTVSLFLSTTLDSLSLSSPSLSSSSSRCKCSSLLPLCCLTGVPFLSELLVFFTRCRGNTFSDVSLESLARLCFAKAFASSRVRRNTLSFRLLVSMSPPCLRGDVSLHDLVLLQPPSSSSSDELVLELFLRVAPSFCALFSASFRTCFMLKIGSARGLADADSEESLRLVRDVCAVLGVSRPDITSDNRRFVFRGSRTRCFTTMCSVFSRSRPFRNSGYSFSWKQFVRVLDVVSDVDTEAADSCQEHH